MKTESKATTLRSLKQKWTLDLGTSRLDKINQEILKLSMKSGPITEKDIALCQKKLQINVSPVKERAAVGGTASAIPQNRGADGMLMGQ